MLATAVFTTLLAAPALVFGAPSFITDPGSSGLLIKPSSSSSPTCLTVVPGAGGIVGNGNLVVPAPCSVNSPSYLQGWEINRGSGQVRLKNSNYCLDAGINPANGITMKVWTCLQVSQQTWYYTDDNRIAITGGSQCLDYDQSQSKIQTWVCSPNNSNQVWFVAGGPTPPPPTTTSVAPPVATADGSLHPNGRRDLCLTVLTTSSSRAFSPKNGDLVQLFKCVQNSKNQGWILSRGNTRVCLTYATNFCLDAGVLPIKSGTPLKVWENYPGDPIPQQQWYYTQPGDDHVAIFGGDQCMDLRDGNTAEGSTVQTWLCGNNPNQAGPYCRSGIIFPYALLTNQFLGSTASNKVWTL